MMPKFASVFVCGRGNWGINETRLVMNVFEITKRSPSNQDEKHEQPPRKMGKDVPGYFIDTDKEAQMAKNIYIKCSTSFVIWTTTQSYNEMPFYTHSIGKFERFVNVKC